MDNKLLEVKNLQVSIKTYRGEVQAVRDVSFSIEKGEVFCIVVNIPVRRSRPSGVA